MVQVLILFFAVMTRMSIIILLFPHDTVDKRIRCWIYTTFLGNFLCLLVSSKFFFIYCTYKEIDNVFHVHINCRKHDCVCIYPTVLLEIRMYRSDHFRWFIKGLLTSSLCELLSEIFSIIMGTIFFLKPV